jgi:hypothetical protein
MDMKKYNVVMNADELMFVRDYLKSEMDIFDEKLDFSGTTADITPLYGLIKRLHNQLDNVLCEAEMEDDAQTVINALTEEYGAVWEFEFDYAVMQFVRDDNAFGPVHIDCFPDACPFDVAKVLVKFFEKWG